MRVLLFIILFYAACVSAYSKYEKRDLSNLPPYHNGNWLYYGNVITEPEFIRLTRDDRSQVGVIHNRNPVIFRDWEVQLTFYVHGSGTNLYGDGFAFWYTESAASPGTAFGSRETFRGLGIFFDTYANQNGDHSHDHPYISAMVNDGSQKYDHDRDGTHTEIAGCSTDFRGRDRVLATISYVRNQLSISLEYPDNDKVFHCFTVDNVLLPTGYYLGISAATGDLSDNHDIISIRTFEVDAEYSPEELKVDAARIEPSAGGAAAPRAHVHDSPPQSNGSRVFWKIVLWLFIICLVTTGAYFGYQYYTKQQRRSKRLY